MAMAIGLGVVWPVVALLGDPQRPNIVRAVEPQGRVRSRARCERVAAHPDGLYRVTAIFEGEEWEDKGGDT